MEKVSLTRQNMNLTMFVLFCDAWTPRSVCDALSMMVAPSMTTLQITKTSTWVLSEHEKEQKFNTWCVTRHRTRPRLYTAGHSQTCWLSQQKDNTHRSILSDRKKTRVIRGEHARKSSAKKTGEEAHSLQLGQSSTQFLPTGSANKHIRSTQF